MSCLVEDGEGARDVAAAEREVLRRAKKG